jgi:hypothetical protein
MLDVTAEHYNKLKKRYDAYVALYKQWNGGSDAGVTPFSDFYWRFNYHVKYEDPSTMSSNS